MEIRADDIITAMKCHRIGACDKCPYEGIRNCIEAVCDDAVVLVKTIRANTVREMQAEIINRCVKGGIYPAFVASTIDRIVKEMIDNERPANG